VVAHGLLRLPLSDESPLRVSIGGNRPSYRSGRTAWASFLHSFPLPQAFDEKQMSQKKCCFHSVIPLQSPNPLLLMPDLFERRILTYAVLDSSQFPQVVLPFFHGEVDSPFSVFSVQLMRRE